MSFTIDQVQTLLTVAIPKDPRPALWLTGLMCGLRPGELTGAALVVAALQRHRTRWQ
jgi:hypothetical protein